MKVWITKYALSSGIEEAETDDEPNSVGLFTVPNHFGYFRMNKDAFLSDLEARKAAETMRQEKIASFERQLAKIRQ